MFYTNSPLPPQDGWIPLISHGHVASVWCHHQVAPVRHTSASVALQSHTGAGLGIFCVNTRFPHNFLPASLPQWHFDHMPVQGLEWIGIFHLIPWWLVDVNILVNRIFHSTGVGGHPELTWKFTTPRSLHTCSISDRVKPMRRDLRSRDRPARRLIDWVWLNVNCSSLIYLRATTTSEERPLCNASRVGIFS